MTVTDAKHRGKMKREDDGQWVVYCAGYNCNKYLFLSGNYKQAYSHAAALGCKRQKFAPNGYYWRCPRCIEEDRAIWSGV